MKFKKFTRAGIESYAQALTPPVGSIVAFAGTTQPNGWLFCNGQEVSRATYPELDAVIGTTYGAYTNGSGGSGTTHLRLPDTKGKAIIGAGTGVGATASGMGLVSGTSLTARTLAAASGAETAGPLTSGQTGASNHIHAITGSGSTSHGHTKATDSHAHKFPIYSQPTRAESGYTTSIQTKSGSTESDANTATGISSVSGTFTVDSATSNVSINNNTTTASAAAAHPNVQPSVVTSFIIFAKP